MKKINKSLICSVMAVASLAFSATSCGTTATSNNIDTERRNKTVEVVKQAEGMTSDELFQKAADEIQGGTLKFVGTSSRFKNAIDSFKAELTKKNAACANMTITKSSMVDGLIYTTLLSEIESKVTNGYSGALVQDGYQLQKKGIDTGYFVNYIPKEWKDATETDKDNDSNPFSLQYNFKTWFVNNAEGDTTTIDNVWDITAAKYKGKLQTMDPRNENVNMDWLIMLTQDKWCDNLKTAFEDSSNDNSGLDISKYAEYGEKKKYAYAFMDGYLTNAVFNTDDGKARDNMSAASAKGTIGWIVDSKIASIQETENVSKKNFTNAALGTENADGANPTMHMKGFGGFMYKHYLQVMPYSPYPWTTCAFINYLSTTSTGYAAWGKDIGDYPTMSSVNIDRTKYGHGTLAADGTFTQNNDEANVFPALNDPKLSWWQSATGGNVVVEDPAYIVTQYNQVFAFISSVISNK
ncbi:MAG: hypothetical protein WCR56_03850 [Bacilli bacterium]|jgi:hypothetical protein